LTFPPRFFLIATLLQHPMDSFWVAVEAKEEKKLDSVLARSYDQTAFPITGIGSTENCYSIFSSWNESALKLPT
jgi:hypothetical protein